MRLNNPPVSRSSRLERISGVTASASPPKASRKTDTHRRDTQHQPDDRGGE
jgi:hypothetical protein